MSVRRWGVFVLLLLGFVQILPLHAQEAGLVPITGDNAAQLRLIDTIPNYKAEGYCNCDVEFFSQNGRVVATDQKVRDLDSGQTLDLTGNGYPLALSPDGSLVLVAGKTSGTRLIEVVTGIEHRLMDANADTASFSRDGKLVATSSRDAEAVQVWDVASRTLIKTLGSPRSLSTPQFAGDGRFLIYLLDGSKVTRWSVGSPDNGYSFISDVQDFKLSPDGQAVIAHGYGSAEVWDVGGNSPIARIDKPNNPSSVNSIAISPDRKRMAVSSYNSTVDLYDITTVPERLIEEIKSERSPSVLFTPDSQTMLLTGGKDETICDRDARYCNSSSAFWVSNVQFIDANSGEELNSFKPYASRFFWETALSADGSALITASYAENAIVWRLNGTQAEKVAELPGDSFTLSPDGSAILTQMDDKILGVYAIPSSGHPQRSFVLSGSIVPNTVSLRAEPSSDAAIIGHASGDVLVMGRSGEYAYLPEQQGWVRADPLYLRLIDKLSIDALPEIDPSQVKTALPTPITISASTSEVTETSEPTLVTGAALSALQLTIGDPIITPPAVPNGLIRVEAENAAQVSLLGVLPQSAIEVDTYPLLAPAISPDGQQLFVPPLGDSLSARVWDLRTFTQTNSLQVLSDNKNSFYGFALAASPDGKIAYTPNGFGQPLQIRSLNPAEGTLQKSFDEGRFSGRDLIFSPDGKTLYSSGGLLDTATVTLRTRLDVSGNAYFSTDSRLLALVTSERAYIIDVATGKQIAFTPRQTGYDDHLDAPVFSPDDRWLAALTGKTITVYDTSTGAPIFTWANRVQLYPYDSQIAFSPDAHYLMILSPEGVFDIIDLEARQVIGSYTLTGAVYFAFSPDGHMLAVGNPIRLLDLTTGVETPLPGNYAGAGMTFTPDGATLLVDSEADWRNDLHTVMAFGIPTDSRPLWKPLTARVVPSGITARSKPENGAARVGFASGEITISARNQQGTAVFVPALNGWVWSAPAYLNLDSITLDMLPERAAE